MKQTIQFGDFQDAFIRMNRKENFSYQGKKALFEYLEEYEQNTGEEIELDVITLCCEYNEDSIEDVLANYSLESLDELRENTTVIWEDGTDVLYQNY